MWTKCEIGMKFWHVSFIGWYTRDSLQREARALETSLHPAREGSPPYPTCCYGLLCALYDACSQSVSDAMWLHISSFHIFCFLLFVFKFWSFGFKMIFFKDANNGRQFLHQYYIIFNRLQKKPIWSVDLHRVQVFKKFSNLDD